MQNIKSTEPKYGDWGRMKKIKTGLMMFMNLVAICLAPIWVKSFAKGKAAGIIPKDVTLGGSWSTGHRVW